MLNILIANSNIDSARDLMAHINLLSNHIRVSNIALDGKEALNILNDINNTVNIVLLDYDLPTYNGLEIVNGLSKLQKVKYQKSILLTSNNPEFVDKINNDSSDIIYRCVLGNLDSSTIVSNINDLIVDKQLYKNVDTLKNDISNELLYLGYDFSHKGTQYLVDIIDMAYLCGESLLENLNRLVYPVIAKKYNQSSNNIKCNVIRSTECMYYNCDEKKLLSYFSFCEPTKPNMKTVINAVVSRISANAT